MTYDEIKDMPLAEALTKLSLAELVQALRHTYRPFFAAAISQAAKNDYKARIIAGQKAA
ncbi:hypothetical protein [uncultured Endozoicomonas sp.]|uniref:hypothetical protein n=1 Tax=uncultured Endozoicomonas sp. TaxID=432652 RepID=UPI0026036F89|nr:hypothetical protein [uncultured Endozoicomonas sp.]